MKYLLDTNICIGLLNGKEPTLLKKFKAHDPEDFVLCSVVKAELVYGAKKSQFREKNEQKLKIFFKEFSSLVFDDVAAQVYGELRAYLESSGKMIGGHDLLIASIAVANDLILITRNTKEFSRLASLKIESW